MSLPSSSSGGTERRNEGAREKEEREREGERDYVAHLPLSQWKRRRPLLLLYECYETIPAFFLHATNL